MCAIKSDSKIEWRKRAPNAWECCAKVSHTAKRERERKKCPRRNKFVYNWNLVIHPYNLLVLVSVCGAISNVIFNLLGCFFLSTLCFPVSLLSVHVILHHTRSRLYISWTVWNISMDRRHRSFRLRPVFRSSHSYSSILFRASFWFRLLFASGSLLAHKVLHWMKMDIQFYNALEFSSIVSPIVCPWNVQIDSEVTLL